MFNYRLRTAPTSVKVMVAGYLLALGLAYIYALANIALVIGWTPRDIAVHYYGAAEVVKSEQAAPVGEESFSLDEIETQPTEPVIGIRPSFKNLVQEGHFHLFGMTSFFFGLTVFGLFTGVRERTKCILVGAPYIAVIFDNLSFMATRFLGPQFAYLTAIAGGFMGICFAALWLVIGYEILKK
ncbi:MAG: hypothetical protein KDD38_11105 [Bdellovibrionales bacterium]|nr:hypothetical protein [Bdellovibrionales bacterium]